MVILFSIGRCPMLRYVAPSGLEYNHAKIAAAEHCNAISNKYLFNPFRVVFITIINHGLTTTAIEI